MARGTKQYTTTDYTVSYTSSSVISQSLGTRTGVFHVQLGTGDSALLQGRSDPSLEYVDILTITDEPAMVEIVLAYDTRVVVTNTSGGSVFAYLTG